MPNLLWPWLDAGGRIRSPATREPARRSAVAVRRRVEDGEPRVLHLRQHLELQLGVDVREEHERTAAVALVEMGMEIGEHVELGFERVRVAQLEVVLAAPAEGAALRGLEAAQVDAAALERRAVLGYLTDFEEGRYRVTNPRLGLELELRWPLDLFPAAWFWQELHASPGYPWYRRLYTTALEPNSDIVVRRHGEPQPPSQ